MFSQPANYAEGKSGKDLRLCFLRDLSNLRETIAIIQMKLVFQ